MLLLKLETEIPHINLSASKSETVDIVSGATEKRFYTDISIFLFIFCKYFRYIYICKKIEKYVQ